MDLNDYLSRLQDDLQSRIDDVNRSLSDVIGTNSGSSISYCPECGAKLEGAPKFCPNCGTNLRGTAGEEPDDDEYYDDEDEEYDEDYDDEEESPRMRGVLFTDIRVLAEKYDCPQELIREVLDYIKDVSCDYGMDWEILNVDDYVCDDLWIDYNDTLSDFLEKQGFTYGIKTPVFIIGGDDVIPIPMVEDPFGSSDSGRIPCDMCYAFSGNFFSDLWDGGDRSITEDQVRNSVSRLPLEDGKMRTTFEQDMRSYFDNCEEYFEDGIPVDGVMMTANVSWLPASRTMSEHLPLVQHTDDEDVVFSGMYVSPPVSPDNDETLKPVQKTLSQVDMLLFNLHGTDIKGMSGFYSDGGEAFNIGLLDNTGATVLNTVACFGARYHGYARNDSMLLTSLYEKGFLLYAGSLIPVPMTDLNVPEGVEVHEGSGSEHLMPIFCAEQYTGKPMGEAMMTAKLKYFNTFRHLERDDFSLATMMMFSLYGNPMLKMQRNEEVLAAAERMHVLPELPESCKGFEMPIRLKKTRRIWGKGASSESLLNEIRGAVDAGLDALHKGIRDGLYAQLGLEPRWLDHIDEYQLPNGDGTSEKGFVYAYDDKSRAFGGKAWVEVDPKGKVRRKFTTK